MLNKEKYLTLIMLVAITTFFFLSCSNPKEKKVANTGNTDGFESTKTGYDSSFYNNGKLKIVGYLENGQRNGLWQAYYPTGVKWSEGEFRNGKNHGKSKVYYETGASRYEGLYIQGQKAGKWFFWDEAGNLIKNIDYTENPDGVEIPLEQASNK